MKNASLLALLLSRLVQTKSSRLVILLVTMLVIFSTNEPAYADYCTWC